MNAPTDRSTAPAWIETLESRRLLSGSLLGSLVGRLPEALPVAGTTQVVLRLTNPARSKLVEPVTIQLLASTTSTQAGEVLLLAAKQQPIDLKAKAAVVDRFSFSTPTTLPSGNYLLLAEANGSILTSQQVNIEQPASSLALNFTGVPTLPIEMDGPSAGQRIATVHVVNNGNVPISGTVDLRFYLSADGTMSTAQLLQTDANVSVSLKPNGNRTVAFRISIPPGTVPGGYFLLAQLSANGKLATAVTTNYLAASSERVSVVTQLPHPLQINENLNVNVTVEDDGVSDESGAAANFGCGCASVDTGVSDTGDLDTSAPDDSTAQDTSSDASSPPSDSSSDNPSDNGDISSSSGDDF